MVRRVGREARRPGSSLVTTIGVHVRVRGRDDSVGADSWRVWALEPGTGCPCSLVPTLEAWRGHRNPNGAAWPVLRGSRR